LLEPGWVTVKGGFGELLTYELRIPGREMVVRDAREIWHLRSLAWTNYFAMEPVQMAREALGLGMAIEEGQARLLGRGQRGSGYIAVDGILQGQHAQLKKWLEDSGGVENSDKPLILDRAAKWVSASLSNIDAQTLEQRRFQVEEICRIMRVSPLMIGHTTAGTSTYGTVEQLFIAHDKHTIGPWVRRLELAADARLMSGEDIAAGFYTKFNEKALTRMTAVDQMSYLEKATRARIMTRNEAREKLELNPVDGGDDFDKEAPQAPSGGGNV
jgi:HK97 family phage portal protein